MAQYWFMRRHLSEGMQWLRRVLDAESSSPNIRAMVLYQYARLSRRHGEYEATRRLAEESAELSKQLGLTAELSRSLTLIGMVRSHAGDLVGAR